MKMTLVNHGGIIQDKFIIRNEDDLIDYYEITAKQHGNALCDFSDKPNRVRDIMEMIAQNNKTSMLIAGATMTNMKIESMMKYLNQGHVIVVNMAGGYTYWDDKCMSIVDESERPKEDDDEYFPIVQIGSHKVLVLENQKEIPETVKSFITNELKQESFSSITNLETDYNNGIGTWIKQALQMGCDTIVAETQLMNEKQLQQMVTLFNKLPAMTFHIFTRENLKGMIYSIAGNEHTNQLYSKHNIIIH